MSAPDISPAPLQVRGVLTFGVTARGLKVAPACLDVFARIVAALPGAVIRFIGEVAVDWPFRRDILARMAAQGVDADRVFFEGFVPHADYLVWFAGVDVVLDSFPANGGLSLLDPLWMGVPVVTLAGDWAGARQGASLLDSLGLGEWVAETEDAFVARALTLGRDADGLVTHRQTLRARMRGSPLVDGRRVAAQIETFCAQIKGRHAAELRDRLRPITLPVEHEGTAPELSVILVLSKKAGPSRPALQALADQRGVGFETIVVDDGSADHGLDLLAGLDGAHTIRNSVAQGALLAARQGVACARGKYLVFLSSEAILQKGALEAALARLHAEPRIGALGGRVVRADGTLFEAGNAVFRDGSVGAIGQGDDAFGHAAQAARAVDWVSGAFLATPAAVWHLLGGFDESFAAVNGEDADYCLRAWQAGYRVVYEPTVVLQLSRRGAAADEHASECGEHKRALLYHRHAAELGAHPAPHVVSLDRDRWCSPEDCPRRPRVLFIDDEVPHMVKGGGLPRARLMLQALRDWPVTLLPLWGLQEHWHAIYASLPRSVEVALGYGLEGLEAFLERRRGVYDVLLVSRPPNLRALASLRARRPELFAGMRLVYDAEALYALRDIRKAAVQGRPMTRAAARARVDAEVALADGASTVLVVSQRDARHFKAAGHHPRILSHGTLLRRGAPGLSGRSGLLFVGALHPDTPNEDGLLWFIREVLPLLRESMAVPPTLSVVGVCLSDAIAALANDTVHILGPQQALEPHYDAARVFIAPVRFAGGVPAKVIEAAAAGIPTVASALLVRQLGWQDGVDIIGARDAHAFAESIHRLYHDDTAWLRQQQAAWARCASSYDPGMFGETLRSVLAQGPAPRDFAMGR
jgi:glycosyltransferase involved in cell wall biosynthesis